MIRTWLVILSVILSAAVFNSAERPIDKIQEARIAETAREMVVSGQWLMPHYNGELRLQKPPLTYWTAALSYQWFGVSELSTRIPSLLFVILSALVLWYWLTCAVSPTAALATVWVLITSFLGMRYLRSGEAETTLMFFVILACYASYQIVEIRFSNKYVFVLFGALGLGFLTKGPPGIVIPLFTMIFYVWRYHKLEMCRILANRLAWIFFVFVAFGWYCWMLLKLPEATLMFLSRQLDETFISGTHKQPVYWYLAHGLEFFAPWSLLLIPMLVWLKNLQCRPSIIQFALCWLLVVFVLLTSTINKQTQYALLFLPPLSILIGYYLDKATGRYQWINRCFAMLFACAVSAIVMVVFHEHGWRVLDGRWAGVILIPLMLGSTLKLPKYHFSILVIAVLTVFNYLLVEQYLSKNDKSEDIRQLMQIAKNKQVLYQESPANGAISFYAGRIVPAKDSAYLRQAVANGLAVWVVGKSQPKIASVKTEIEYTTGEWRLWKLSRQ